MGCPMATPCKGKGFVGLSFAFWLFDVKADQVSLVGKQSHLVGCPRSIIGDPYTNRDNGRNAHRHYIRNMDSQFVTKNFLPTWASYLDPDLWGQVQSYQGVRGWTPTSLELVVLFVLPLFFFLGYVCQLLGIGWEGIFF